MRLAQPLAADVLVRPIVAFERPVLLAVAQVARRLERIERGLRQARPPRAPRPRPRARACAEHRLDAAEARAPEQPREAQLEPAHGVLGERGARLDELRARRLRGGVELARASRDRLAAGRADRLPLARRRCRRPARLRARRAARLDRVELAAQRSRSRRPGACACSSASICRRTPSASARARAETSRRAVAAEPLRSGARRRSWRACGSRSSSWPIEPRRPDIW